MNDVAGQYLLCVVHHKNGVYSVVRFCEVRNPHSTKSSSSTQWVYDSFKDQTILGLMPLNDKTIHSFDLSISLQMIDRSIIELNAHVDAPKFHLIGCKVRAVVSDDDVGDAVTVYDPGYEVYHRSGFGRLNRLGFYPFGELIHHDK